MLERLSLFCLGGGAYAALELAWRGTTHWTMFLAGGVCLCLLHIAVWDYADEWGNLAGLVCPRYTFYWFLLCGWVVFVLRGVESTVYHPQKSVQKS